MKLIYSYTRPSIWNLKKWKSAYIEYLVINIRQKRAMRDLPENEKVQLYATFTSIFDRNENENENEM